MVTKKRKFRLVEPTPASPLTILDKTGASLGNPSWPSPNRGCSGRGTLVQICSAADRAAENAGITDNVCIIIALTDNQLAIVANAASGREAQHLSAAHRRGVVALAMPMSPTLRSARRTVSSSSTRRRTIIAATSPRGSGG